MTTKLKTKLKTSKVLKNISWLIAGKIAQNVISLALTFFTARFLGPSNYGVIGYVSSYTAFFSSLCNLGINGIIVKEFVNKPSKNGEYVGTAIVLKLISSLICSISFVIFMLLKGENDETILVSALLSLSTIFNAFDVINYWYQSKLNSKKEAIIGIIAYLAVAVYKIIILIFQKNVAWFAFANSLDIMIVAMLLIIFYFKDGGQKWKFSFKTSRNLLKQSYHLILSGILVSIFAQTDKIMIGNMIDTRSVGLYTIAVNLAVIISFLPTAIIDSMRPVIMEYKNKDEKIYVKKVKQLYSIIIWLSILYSLFITIFARIIILIIYGEEYLEAVPALRVIVWYTTFSYLGGAKNVWLIAENKQNYEKWFTLIGAIMNILLNFILIPICGIIGAAIASLITQIIANFAMPFLFKETRVSSRYMIEALSFKNIFFGKRDKNV